MSTGQSADLPAPIRLRFEHLDTGFGIGYAAPRLSWQLPVAPTAVSITAVEVELTGAAGIGTRRRIDPGEQVLAAWPFPPLPSRFRGALRMRLVAGDTTGPWSDPVDIETTLLDAADWTARFISPRGVGRVGTPAPILTRTFDVPDGVVRARLHVTALGLHVTTINGARVSDEELAPGWTAYRHRLRFGTHDVTALLRPGRNDLEMLLGDGWYRGRLGWGGRRGLYGDRLAGLAQLEIATADGAQHVIGTDGDWTARPSGVLAHDLYDGQTTDLRPPAETGTDPVDVLDEDLARLVPPAAPPVRVVATVAAVAVTRSPSGATLVDFGENLVGWVRLRVRQAAGQRIQVRHAEVLEHGELGVRPLRTAKATDLYLLPDSGGEQVLEPALTFHGFRYAEITGVDPVTPDDVEAVVLSSDLRPTGSFRCSDPDLEVLHANVVRSMRGNFLDVPTDCPQRDERMGWTGDIQIFAPTAAFIADSAGFLTSWLRDLAAEQHADGSVPFVIPDVLDTPAPAAAAWGDAATVVPWTLYQRYGDLGVLEAQYESMRAWVDREVESAGPDRLWSGGFQFGDWLDPTAPPDAPAAAKADPDVVATAHLVRSADIVAATARLLGHEADAEHYAELAAQTRAAFAGEYVTATGRIVSDAPTVYALALVWDLLPSSDQRAGAGRRLADLVRAAGFRISTGFVGTPLITDALAAVGEHDVAYRLLLERGCPSWLYPVTMGATTIWERWDSMLPDGTINPGQMTSFNHYALGAVADWLHRTVAGLAPAAPGYRRILVRPIPGGGLTHASARLDTPYGQASVAWQRAEGRFHLEVTVPPGTEAAVHVPGAPSPENRGPGTHRWDVADPAPTKGTAGTVRDAFDDPGLWSALTTAAIDSGAVSDPVAFAGRASRWFDHPLAVLPRAMAWPASGADPEKVEAALSTVLARNA